MLHKMTHRWIQTYSNYVEVDFTSILQLAFSSQNAWSLICTSLGSLQNEARKLPSGNQTISNMVCWKIPPFIRTMFPFIQMPRIYELCPIAMFDYRRLAHHPSLALQIHSASGLKSGSFRHLFKRPVRCKNILDHLASE